MPGDIDEIVFRTDLVAVGRFRCPVGDARFRDSGPIRQSCFVFPRTAVVIEHADRRPFIGDPALATLYNAGQRYERRPISPDGDRCDWFAVTTGLLCDAVRPLDPAAADEPPRAMRHAHAPVAPSLYLEQRQLFTALLGDGAQDPLEIEERILSLLGRVLRAAYGRRPPATRAGRRAEKQRADVASAVRERLAQTFTQRVGLTSLARSVGASPFHLCRSFREVTGSTVHQHVTTLRLRAALERLDAGEDLTRIALDSGFSSHSHFTAAFRRQFGVAPSRVFRANQRRRP